MARQQELGVRLAAVTAAIAAVLLARSPLAQQPSSVNVDVGNCVGLPTPAERSACYEANVEAALRQREAGGATAPPAVAPTAAAPPAPPAAPPAAASDRETAVEIVATVTEARESVPNHLVITLDNGQIWRQVRPEPYPLRVGQKVTLSPTRWGPDYRLTTADRKSFIQVERLR